MRAARTRRGGAVRRAVPLLYLAIASAAAVLVLPTALRPPPDPSTESGAISPDAPPDDNPEQLIQSVQQAAGGGAGATAGTSTSTTAPPPGVTVPEITTTSLAKKAGSGFCFGNPKRQTESIYSPPCGPAFVGDNGGVTSHNVLPNELHLSFNHVLGAPPDGPVPDAAAGSESAETRTMRVLQAYVNQRFETYGRRIRFYGTGAALNTDQSLANSAKADEQYKVFASYNLDGSFCQDQTRRGNVAFCNPQSHEFYVRNRPGMFSWQMEFDQMFGFGAEYYCKRLRNRPAEFAGSEKGKPRKIAFVGEHDGELGIPATRFAEAVKRECGETVAQLIELSASSGPGAAAATIAKLRSDGDTTVILNTALTNTVYLMTAAGSSYSPEWVLLGNLGIDFNQIGNLLPKNQSSHLFGLSSWELARRPDESECFRAYKSIDPENDPSTNTCTVFWHPINMMMAGIQGAGPRLTPAAFQKALFALGHRYEQTPWAIGGGYGPDDYSYMDSVGEIWFDSAIANPETGAPGAYRWTKQGRRYRRGQLDADTSELFTAGITAPPPGT